MDKAHTMWHRHIVLENKKVLKSRGFLKKKTFYANWGVVFVRFMRSRYQYSAELHCQSSGTLSNIAILLLKPVMISTPYNVPAVLTWKINSEIDQGVAEIPLIFFLWNKTSIEMGALVKNLHYYQKQCSL